MTLALVEADPRLQQSYLAALDELAAEGNAHYLDLVVPPGPGFAGVAFTARSLAAPEVFAEFCRYTRALERPDTPRPAGWVPGCYLWIVEDGEEVLGRISLRHELTPWLLEVGGHIGYAVRPSRAAPRGGHRRPRPDARGGRAGTASTPRWSPATPTTSAPAR